MVKDAVLQAMRRLLRKQHILVSGITGRSITGRYDGIPLILQNSSRTALSNETASLNSYRHSKGRTAVYFARICSSTAKVARATNMTLYRRVLPFVCDIAHSYEGDWSQSN
ncbi:hypothetical protein CERSUDRAFT_119962 [Gelatoporia subvermispora B]|uniref:Uncharacterized protein n=1 Tax=Ceriporiopsis subvermispora (strain B) TaxID=914234 RepID=M2QGI7_CERS8|nr:hypothetical protein CERSUDRAFT_119962 [Gelatoporia subvermispora B]